MGGSSGETDAYESFTLVTSTGKQRNNSVSGEAKRTLYNVSRHTVGLQLLHQRLQSVFIGGRLSALLLLPPPALLIVASGLN